MPVSPDLPTVGTVLTHLDWHGAWIVLAYVEHQGRHNVVLGHRDTHVVKVMEVRELSMMEPHPDPHGHVVPREILDPFLHRSRR